MPFFRANNPFNTVLLFAYAFLLKFSWLRHPKAPEVKWMDGWFGQLLKPKADHLLVSSPIIYSSIVYLLIVTQALMINRVVNQQRMMPKANYMPAMCYILITSLFPEWNVLSGVLIAQTFLLWAWSKMNRLYNTSQPKTILFNIGLLTGLVSILYFPATAYGLLLLIAIAINRPFHPREWLVALLGVVTPYYFLISLLYLNDHFQLFYIPYLSPGIPVFHFNSWQWTAIIILLLALVTGFYYAHSQLSKQVVQVRKSWYTFFAFLIISVVISLLFSGNLWQYYLLAAVPLSVYTGAAFFYPRKRWFPIVLHWLLFAFVISFSYFNK
jgi:hypothetical protein